MALTRISGSCYMIKLFDLDPLGWKMASARLVLEPGSLQADRLHKPQFM